MNQKFYRHFLIAVALTVSLSILPFPASGKSDRGIGVVEIKDKSGKQIGIYNQSHALVVGVSNYFAGWPSLPGVLNDVTLVRQALEKHGFNVVVIEDPDRRQMEDAINQFINLYGQDPLSRVVFYFAGHGHTLNLTYGGEMGYIVPKDAPDPNVNRAGFLAKAIDMQQFEVYAKRIQAKHALFLFDSCFSGSIFSLSRAIPEHINYKTSKPVRQFITAGSANETVPDESIFRAQFVAALDGEGDVDGDGYVTGVELGEFLQKTVVNYSKGYQHPQYGKIRDRNLDKGDIVFPLKTVSLPPAASPQIPSAVPKAPMQLLLKGHLQINVNVPSAKVILGDEEKGTAKLGEPLNLFNIPTGKVSVRLEAEGHEPLEREVTIRKNLWTQEIFEFSTTRKAKSKTSQSISTNKPKPKEMEMCWDGNLGELVPCGVQ